MPLPVPNLDDRQFDDLVEEGRGMIAQYAPEWTNYNPSDPGIMLLELFAWLSESVLYRLNQIPEERYVLFLDLLGVQKRADESVSDAVRRALRALSSRSRAVTIEDYEFLGRIANTEEVRQLAAQLMAAGESTVRLEQFAVLADVKPDGIRRAKAIAKGSRVQLYLLPDVGMPPEGRDALLQAVAENLRPFLLITTRLEVLAAVFAPVSVRVAIVGRLGQAASDLRKKVVAALDRFYHAYEGGAEGTGWPFGRGIYRAELYQIVEAVKGVDYVSSLSLNGDSQRDEVQLQPHQLVNLAVEVIVESEPGE